MTTMFRITAGLREAHVRRARFITIYLAALVATALVPAWAGATPATFVDDTFAGGAPDASTTIAPPGSVQLAPATPIDEGFSGTTLPTGWESSQWTPPNGAATVAGDALSVDGALAGTTAAFDAPQSLSFRATFTGDGFQHVGLGRDLNNDPNWAIFSTGGGALTTGLWARTNVGGTAVNVQLDPATNPLVVHDYEIRWTTSQVVFLVDGAVVSTQAATLANQLRPLASDFNVGGGVLIVDSLRLRSYPASGAFASQVVDGGAGLNAWGSLTAEGTLAGVTFETRSGDVPTPDASWSAFQPLGAAGAIESPARRYLQYRATLASDGITTPSVDRVTIAFDVDATAPTAAISGVAVSGTTATVTFSSPDADVAGFECSLDGGAFARCTSPAAFPGLGPGTHTVAVRAIDRAGNVGAPISQGFTVAQITTQGRDTTKPKVVLSPRSLRASAGGRVGLRLKCPRSEQLCRVTLRLKRGKATVASKTVTVRGGRTVKVGLRLRKGVMRYLSTHSRLRLTGETLARDAAGNQRVARVTLTLRAPVR
jgi:hypothetical protein